MDTKGLKVTYYLDVQLGHAATFGANYEVNAARFPIFINPELKGSIPAVINLSEQNSASMLPQLP
jgi:hypothetical protein